MVKVAAGLAQTPRPLKPGGGPTRPARATLPGVGRLLAAERKMVSAYVSGSAATISKEIPEKAPGVRVRAKVIRALLMSPDRPSAGGAGLALEGAYIEGALDLSVCTIERVLKFWKCRFEEQPLFYGAALSSLSLEGSEVPGLQAEYLTTDAALFLNNGFVSNGEVRLVSATIGGSLECGKGSFVNPKKIALNGQGMSVKQSLLWRRVTKVDGRVDLVDARVGTFVDDLASWLLPNDILLDGLVYSRIDSKDISADHRITWLKRQQPRLFGETFWSQPWEQLAKVMRDIGHPEQAKLISMEKQREMRRHGLVGSRQPSVGLKPPLSRLDHLRVRVLNSLSWLLHVAYGGLAGYGYRPLRTFILMVLFWIGAAGVFQVAEQRGLFAPTAFALLADKTYERCGPVAEGRIRWTRCPQLPRDYTTFDPLMYSLDAILPLVDLKQEGDWEPLVRRGRGWRMWDGLLVRGIMWAEILFGWIGSLLIVSALGRLVQKD
jgi:hypothetical protein